MTIVVSGGFDDLRSGDVRFLEESAKLGPLTVLLWSDGAVVQAMGRPPKFPEAERRYLLAALRYVSAVHLVEGPAHLTQLPEVAGVRPDMWVVNQGPANPAQSYYAHSHGLAFRVLDIREPDSFPEPPPMPTEPRRKKVLATGCFDWFHSGHVRFFEEASGYGDLYVVVGHDANIRMLKGEGHPLLPQDERRYLVGSVRFVKQALISTGRGWMDAEPEIQRIQPDVYAVNEDGDRGGKREFCAAHGVEYLVLKRAPAPGLPRRSSTDLRGF